MSYAPKIAMIATALILAGQAYGFQLSPMGTAAERKFAKRWNIVLRAEIALTESGVHHFSDPVHEALTQRIFGCDGDWADCRDPDLEHAGPYVMAGVRWNDDPVFQLQPGEGRGLSCRAGETVSFITQMRCWVGLFKDAVKRAADDPEYFTDPKNGNYLLRSHFGDLQFLHAMATRDGEPAAETKQKIMMWAEFVWGIQEGKYRLATRLKEIDLPGWLDTFQNGHTVQDLFTLGRPWLRPHLKEVAFGSLLHLIEDSFADGHVDRREPIFGLSCMDGRKAYGAIREFHSYARQDHDAHKAADSNERAQDHLSLAEPDVVDAGETLRELRDADATWNQVREFLDTCVLSIDEDSASASAGDRFRMEL